MAKSNSFNKRELEKKKQQKRIEKQQRKEERKNNPVNTFEDMIAYVDANGVITDTPPEMVNEKIDPDEIEISIPKKEEVETPSIPTGRVEYYDETKGFGFIKDKYSINKYFFHKSNALQDMEEGMLVTFDLERGLKGMNAVNVKAL